MSLLWAPWRKAYIRPSKAKKSKGCLFCRVLREKSDRRNLILKRSLFSFAILNLYPYNAGHVMIVPKRHVKKLSQLSPKEKLDWLELASEITGVIEKKMKPQAMNLGMNLGCPAGAGIPGHMHLHIVPRWNGDTNFMPVIGKTKVISESMESIYKTLSAKSR